MAEAQGSLLDTSMAQPAEPMPAPQPEPSPYALPEQKLAPGLEKEQKLRAAGFGNDDITKWRDQRVQTLSDAGFSQNEIGEYFGVKPAPDMSAMRSYIETNLKNNVVPGNFPGMEQPGNIDLSKRPQVKNPETGQISTVLSMGIGIDGGKEVVIPRVSDDGRILSEQEAIDLFRKTGKHLGVFADKAAATKYSLALHEDQAKFVKAQQKPAESLIDAIEAGYQMSVAGLVMRGQAPDKILPQDAGMFMRIASQIGNLAGDFPTMVAGVMAGGAAGSAAGPLGATVGGGAGAMALPQAIRSTLMQHYEKGDVQSFSDFWERSSAVFLDTLKAGITGGATAGVAGPVARLMGPLAAPEIVKTGTVAASEIATMVTVGKALEGQAPNPQDFIDAAIVVGGMHGAGRVATKLRSIYAETGVKPTELAEMAQKNPAIQEDLLSSNIKVPRALDGTQPTVKEPTPEPAPRPSRELSEAEKTIASRISLEEKQNVQLDEKGESADDFDTFYTKAFDALYPVRDLVKELSKTELNASKDPYKLMRLLGGNPARASVFLKDYTYDFHTLKKTGDSLQTTLKPIADDLNGFRIYTVAARALELFNRKKPIETGIDIEAAKQVVAEGKAKFEPVAQKLYEYNNRVIDYMVEAGVIARSDAKTFKDANKNYVPFKRLLDEEGKPVGTSAGSGVEPRNPVKAIKGSDRAVIDPIRTIIENTHLYITMAERNRAMLALKNLAETSDAGGFFMKHLKPKSAAIEATPEEVSKFLEKYDIEDTNPAVFKIFRPMGKVNLADNEIVLFDKGKRQIYEVSPNVATSIRALDRENMNVVIKFLNASVKTLRAGVTLSPDFIGRNVWRDQVPAYVQSKNGYIPYMTAVDGLRTIFKNEEDFINWKKGGGGNADITSLGTDYVLGDISKIAQDTGFMNRVKNVVTKPIELLHIMSEVSEQSTRVGDFKRGTRKDKSAENIFEQAFNSRELVIDYHRIGASNSVRAMNLITAFWNARLQGLERTGRAFAEDPLGTTMKTMAAVTLPSVLLYLANKDDPRWNDGTIPRWQKDLFWIVMSKEHIYRIPKPFELGILFGSIPERVLESYYKDNPKAFKDLSDTIIQGINPGFIPTFISPFIEHFGNKSLFTSGPVIPKQLEGMLPADQYTDYTTESAKKLGQFVRVFDNRPGGFSSPAVVENYIRAWSGNTGLYALQLADQLLLKSGVVDDPHKPAAKVEEYPFIKAFMIKNPTRQNQNIQDFYKAFADTQAQMKSFKHRMNAGNIQGAMSVIESSSNYINLNNIQTSLGHQDAMVHKIIQNPDIPKEQKSQMIDGMIDGMIQTATMGLKVHDQFQQEMKQLKGK